MIVIYDTTTGRINRCTNAAGQAGAGEAELDVPGANYGIDATHYVENGALTAFPAKPSEFHDWDWPSKSWAPNLAAARTHVKGSWGRWLESKKQAGCEYAGMPLHSDDLFMAQVVAMVVDADLGLQLPPYVIRRRDNVNHACATSAELKQIAKAVGAHIKSAYAASWAAKDTLDASPDLTLAEILALLPP